MIWDHVCVSVEDEEAASCNLHDFGYVASTAVSPIRQLGLGERETIFRLLYERVMPWPSDNTHAPTSIHAMRRIRTALTHTHGAGGTAFTKKKSISKWPPPRRRPHSQAARADVSVAFAWGRAAQDGRRPGRSARARRGVHGAHSTSASRPGQVPLAGRAVGGGPWPQPSRKKRARGRGRQRQPLPAQRFRRRRHSSV